MRFLFCIVYELFLIILWVFKVKNKKVNIYNYSIDFLKNKNY